MDDNYEDELDVAISRWEAKKETTLSPKSVQTYRYAYIRLLDLLQRRELSYIKEKTIIDALEGSMLTPDVKNLFINVAIICRSSLNMLSAKLETWRQNKLTKETNTDS